jgi:hypothetical protein
MKRVFFVLAALCALSSIATGDDFDFADDGARQHITKGHAKLRAGDLRGALSHFCTYMYIDAAGAFADEASLNARTISGKLGNPTQSDHDACEIRKPASDEERKPTATTMFDLSVTQKPPIISKREVVGLGLVAASVVSLGLALREGGKVVDMRNEIDSQPAGVNLDALRAREDSAQLHQKLYLVGGGAALITGGILYVLGRRDRINANRTYVAPNIGRGMASVSLSRGF